MKRKWMRWTAAVLTLAACTAAQAQEHAPQDPPAHGESTAEKPHDEPGPTNHDGESHEDGEHHDPYDLTEANAAYRSNLRQVSLKDVSSGEGADPMTDPAEWRFDMAFFTVLVFLLLFGALGKFAWKPIVQGLDQRESAIAAMIDKAQADQELAAQKLAEYEERLAAATQEAQAQIDAAKTEAVRIAEKIRADAEADAASQRARAIADIQAAKSAALSEIAEKSVDAALGLAGNIVGQKLQRGEHEQLIRNALDRFPTQS